MPAPLEWCVALVSAIIVIISDKGRPEYVWLSAIPMAMFLFLDAFYLGLERRFCDRYNAFTRKVHLDEASVDDVFIVSPGRGAKETLCDTFRAFGSLSVWPFYGLLGLMLVIVGVWLLPMAKGGGS